MNQNVTEQASIIKKGLEELVKFQIALDEATWAINDSNLTKIRHILLHMTVINGALARICEKWEHDVKQDATLANQAQSIDNQVMSDIIADILMHAMQLSNTLGISPYVALSQRVSKNIERFAPDSEIKLPL